MRRKAPELYCEIVFGVLYDASFCWKQSYVEAYMPDVIDVTDMANTHSETNMTGEGNSGQSRSCS